MARYDAILVGGGHNALVCAGLLAKAGLAVLLLEAADAVGGAARPAEIAEGFRSPGLAHLLYQLSGEVVGALELEKHGLAYAAERLPTTLLSPDGAHRMIPAGGAPEGVGAADATAWRGLHRRLERFAGALRPMLAATPPRLGTRSRGDLGTLARLGWSLRRLGRDDMREFLRIAGMNVADLAEDELADPLLSAGLAFDAVLGCGVGPRAPGTVLSLLFRLAAAGGSRPGGLALPRGGLAAVAEALARAATAAGVTIRTGAPVARILVEGDRAAGVALADGEAIASRIVVSGVDPQRTFLALLGAEHLDTGFVRRVRNIRARGRAAKLELALDGLPEPRGLSAAALAGRLVWAPSVDHVERASNAVKYGRASAAPVLEAVIPTLADPGLAPAGGHVLSAIVQYAPADLPDADREAFAGRAIAALETALPDLGRRVRHARLLLPGDIEREYGMGGGHWHHGELAFDQLFMLRPVPGAQQYATPLPGLWLCGAGSHPGGGIMGLAGMNAARRLLALEGRA
ncbi:MAG: NAD(P)/FAD-dependent oxidoreductase [Dongiaceae bacterium]